LRGGRSKKNKKGEFMNGEKIKIKKGEVMAALQALSQISNYPLKMKGDKNVSC
jgi:hypothetical protein